MDAVMELPVAGAPDASADVVIAGAGPVGLVLGVLLRQAGLDVAIIDPHFLPGQGSKAAACMSRTFEVFELCNCASSCVELGREMEGARFWVGGNSWLAEARNFHSSQYATRYPVRTLGQNFVESACADRFLELGGRLYRAARATEFSEQENEVSVSVERFVYVRPPAEAPQFPERLKRVTSTTLTAKYFVGCDGKQSRVRQGIGADYVGKDYDQTFILADLEVDEEEVQRKGFGNHNIHALVDAPSGSFLFFVRLQQTRWRAYFARSNLTRADAKPEFIKEQWKRIMPSPGPLEPREWPDEPAVFEVSCRLASKYRTKRVFLAGDAAHCHSPAGGQGMNTGIQDSANLAWKLASVIKGHASEKILDSYEKERRPIAEWVLSTSDQGFQSLTSQSSTVVNYLRRVIMQSFFAVVPSAAFPPAVLRDRMFGWSLTYANDGTCHDTGAAPVRGALRAGDRLADVACRDLDGSSADELVYALKLLAAPPHTALRLFFIMEGSGARENPRSVVAEALGGFQTLVARGVPMQPVLYVASLTQGGWACGTGVAHPRRPGVATDGSPTTAASTPLGPLEAAFRGFEPLRVLMPASAAEAKAAAGGRTVQEFLAVLRLGHGGKAILVVRPDGYVAVAHRGDWNAAPVVTALEDLGLVPPPSAAA